MGLPYFRLRFSRRNQAPVSRSGRQLRGTAWEAAVRRAKITNLRFHDLRHTFASWVAKKGRPLKEIQEALGHKSLAMTMRYAHLSPDNLRAAVASLDGILPSAPWPDGARLAQETHASRNQPRPIGDPA